MGDQDQGSDIQNQIQLKTSSFTLVLSCYIDTRVVSKCSEVSTSFDLLALSLELNQTGNCSTDQVHNS